MKLQSVDYRRVFVVSVVLFTAIAIVQGALAPSLVQRFYPLPEDQGPAWYYWQLADPTVASRLSAWIGYGLHQIVLFVLLGMAWKARRAGGSGAAASAEIAGDGASRVTGASGLGRMSRAGRFNLLVLGVNGLFVALHLVQTQLWYDGLAQDAPIWTSQGSVIVMLVLILFLEMPRRGLFFGKWRRVPKGTYALARKVHGFYIAWAVTYTFWFHPMEGNWGLMSGFLYMFLLFIQLSMFDTKLHMNPGWVVLLEAGVIIHATLITVYKDNPIWPMFLFGFLAMLSFTQVYAFRNRALRIGAMVLYIGGVIGIYGWIRGFNHLYELTFIPVALYGGTIALWLLGTGVEALIGKRKARPA